MFKRKSIAVLLTSVLTMPMPGFVFMLIEGSGLRDALELMVFAALFVTPVILLFGVPVSILSDKINDRFNGRKRVILSFVTHLLSAISFSVFFIITEDFTLNRGSLYVLTASILPACLFWGMDELLRRCYILKMKKEY